MRKTYVFWLIPFVLLGILVLPPLLAARAVYNVAGSGIAELSSNERIGARKGILTSVWDGYPLLKRICAAESNYGPDNEPRQFLPDGSILWGWEDGRIVQRDVGECQINTEAHADELKRLGLDVIHSEADNVAYAKILFHREGWRPWKNSKPHWDPAGLIQ